jgi:hypothetical protein
MRPEDDGGKRPLLGPGQVSSCGVGLLCAAFVVLTILAAMVFPVLVRWVSVWK